MALLPSRPSLPVFGFAVRLTIGVALSIVIEFRPATAVVLVHPAAANHVHSSECPAGDGVNVLVPDPVQNQGEFFLLLTPSAELQNELAGGDTSYAGWTFNYAGGSLGGTWTIDLYKSRFRGDHWSGSEIEARYQKAAGDPANLRWVQLVTTNDPIDPDGPLGPPTSPYIDPYPDDTDGEGGPFYYSDEAGHEFDRRDHENGKTRFGAYDIHFYDFPTREHPPSSFAKWKGELWLTSLQANNTVKFHDGIGYGFEAMCLHWWPLHAYTFGNPSDGILTYDPNQATLTLSPVRVTTLNQQGLTHGVDPQYFTDPMNNAMMQFTPFEHVVGAGLPRGYELFRNGHVDVFTPDGSLLLYSARIPFLVAGDGLHPQYNISGVYDEIRVNPSAPSLFLQQYAQFLDAGMPDGEPPRRDRSNPGDVRGAAGFDPHSAPGHGAQFFVRSSIPIATLLQGGSSPVGTWHSFGQRDPSKGLRIKWASQTDLQWGDLGPMATYDVLRGEISGLLSTSGNFSGASCLADNTTAHGMIDPQLPPIGSALYYIARAAHGSYPGSYDTGAPSQIGVRDATAIACP